MTSVEYRPTGQRILRYGAGRQPLLVIGQNKQEIVWLSDNDDVIRVRRHWVMERSCTECCQCIPPCGTSRVDRLVGVLLHMGTNMWEERLMILPEDGWRSCERLWLLKWQDKADLRGARCVIQRQGSRRNARTTCEPQEWLVDDIPPGFPIGETARKQMHIATDFFGMGTSETEVGEQVIPPARSRRDKPHVPLGVKPKG